TSSERWVEAIDIRSELPVEYFDGLPVTWAARHRASHVGWAVTRRSAGGFCVVDLDQRKPLGVFQVADDWFDLETVLSPDHRWLATTGYDNGAVRRGKADPEVIVHDLHAAQVQSR